MFNSEQQKMRRYRKNLKLEAINDFKQGEALDEFILYQQGIETQSKGLSKFANAIGESVSENLRTVKPIDKIRNWSSNGLDANITTQLKNGPKPKKPTFTYQKADDPTLDANIVNRSKKMPRSIAQPVGPKAIRSHNGAYENSLMGNEDFNMNPPSQTAATPAQVKAQAAAQDNLDLISLFQQDVKEGRKRQTLQALAQMNSEEDHRVRVQLMTVLDEMKRNNTLASSKKERQEQVQMIDQMMALIEKQRLEDAFAHLQYTNAIGEKIARNWKNAKWNKGAERERRQQVAERSKAASIINKGVRASRSRLASDFSNAPTSTGSEGVLGFDGRAWNKGRPKNNTNEELNTFSDLLIEFDSSSGHRRTVLNDKMRGIMKRQNKINPQIGARMKTLLSGLKK